MKKNILFIEPFFSGSHASWLNQLKSHSSHNIELLTLDGKFWKWRMYGAAYTMAQKFLQLDFQPDLIIVSDMMDLSNFLSLIRRSLSPTIPVAIYFHENQFAYPWSSDSKDKTTGRDVNYGFMNYTSALSADWIFFNSEYNRDSFYSELSNLLKKMPDNRHKDSVDELRMKSTILPIGMNLKSIDSGDPSIYQDSDPLILWNHRWEFDKNPADFFKALKSIKDDGLKFKLALLGETYKNSPKTITDGISSFKDDIVAQGYQSKEDYVSWLKAADIAPVTSNHDFFGISIMEAVYAGCIPLLPKRLTYPALYKEDENPELFYASQKELVAKLKSLITYHSDKKKKSYINLATPYDWSNIISQYDLEFESLIERFI